MLSHLLFYSFKKFITKSIIISFSFGLDSAINNVVATKVSGSIIFLSPLYKIPQKSRKYKNIVAPILLFPSAKT